MVDSQKNFADRLDFYYIDDLTTPGVFQDAMTDIDGVIHLASVSALSTTHLNEDQLTMS